MDRFSHPLRERHWRLLGECLIHVDIKITLIHTSRLSLLGFVLNSLTQSLDLPIIFYSALVMLSTESLPVYRVDLNDLKQTVRVLRGGVLFCFFLAFYNISEQRVCSYTDIFIC